MSDDTEYFDQAAAHRRRTADILGGLTLNPQSLIARRV
jgi:hypothetical protein